MGHFMHEQCFVFITGRRGEVIPVIPGTYGVVHFTIRRYRCILYACEHPPTTVMHLDLGVIDGIPEQGAGHCNLSWRQRTFFAFRQ